MTQKLLFIVTEDWFFCSHFLPMARAAKAGGFDVGVVTRVRDHAAVIEAEGLRLIALQAERRSLNPLAVIGTLCQMHRILKREQPDIVHLIALRSILIGGAAARLAGIPRRIIALTGLGFIGAGTSFLQRMAAVVVRFIMMRLINGDKTRFLFENRSDPVSLGLNPDDTSKLRIVGGAGIDPVKYAPAPLPLRPPVRVALVARMLWSKGIDLAVEAVKIARKQGAEVTLSLFGAPDPSNPRAITERQLKEWSKETGIKWHGPSRDIVNVWAGHHIALLPSRGGEGLPRTLLEAAACGRAMVTTDVPGCRDFVRNGRDGVIVASNDAGALADALVNLCKNADKIEMMGASARSRVLEGYTEEAVGRDVLTLYCDMMQS